VLPGGIETTNVEARLADLPGNVNYHQRAVNELWDFDRLYDEVTEHTYGE
jgi:hypothetical protein